MRSKLHTFKQGLKLVTKLEKMSEKKQFNKNNIITLEWWRAFRISKRYACWNSRNNMHIFIYFLFLIFVLYSVELFRFGVDFVLSVVWILVFAIISKRDSEWKRERDKDRDGGDCGMSCIHVHIIRWLIPFCCLWCLHWRFLSRHNHHQVFFEIVVLNQFTNTLLQC